MLGKLNELSKKSLEELEEELKKVNTSLPPVKKLNGWVPVQIVEEKDVVLARKRILNRKTMEEVIAVKAFKPEGVWKEVCDLMVLRKKIIHEMGKIEGKLHGPAVFTSKEFAENDEES